MPPRTIRLCLSVLWVLMLLAAEGCDESTNPVGPAPPPAPPPRVVVDAPAAGTTGLTVTFRWHVENAAPGETYRSQVCLDKGVDPCDGRIEEAFDAAAATCLIVRLDSSRYSFQNVAFGIRITDSTGRTICAAGVPFRVDPGIPAAPDTCVTR